MNALVAILIAIAVIWFILVLAVHLPLWLLFLCAIVLIAFFV